VVLPIYKEKGDPMEVDIIEELTQVVLDKIRRAVKRLR